MCTDASFRKGISESKDAKSTGSVGRQHTATLRISHRAFSSKYGWKNPQVGLKIKSLGQKLGAHYNDRKDVLKLCRKGFEFPRPQGERSRDSCGLPGYRVQAPVTRVYPLRALRATRINGLSVLGLNPRVTTSDRKE